MNTAQEIIKKLVEQRKVVDCVAKQICFNEDGKALLHKEFSGGIWLSFLTARQRSTTSSAIDLFEKRVCVQRPGRHSKNWSARNRS